MVRFDELILYLLIVSLITIPFGLSQDQNANAWQSVERIIAPFASTIFIGIFILILLVVAGVRPKLKPGLPSLTIIALLILIFLAFILPQFVPYPAYISVPDNFKLKPLPSFVSNFFIFLGLPEEWMYLPAIIYLFILPFAGIYAVVWVFLSSLNFLFPAQQQTKVVRFLALIITFLTIPMGWFVKMVWVLFSFMGAWSIALFAVTFVVGSLFRGAGIVQRQAYELKKYTLSIRRVYDDVIKRLNEAKNLPLQQLQAEVNAILNLYGAQLPSGATVVLGQIAQAQNVQEAQRKIDDAIRVLKQQLK